MYASTGPPAVGSTPQPNYNINTAAAQKLIYNNPSGSLRNSPRITMNDIKGQFGLIGGHNQQLKDMYNHKPVMFAPRKGA